MNEVTTEKEKEITTKKLRSNAKRKAIGITAIITMVLALSFCGGLLCLTQYQDFNYTLGAMFGIVVAVCLIFMVGFMVTILNTIYKRLSNHFTGKYIILYTDSKTKEFRYLRMNEEQFKAFCGKYDVKKKPTALGIFSIAKEIELQKVTDEK